MATIGTTATPDQRYQPYVGLPELQRAQSGIARAEVIFSDVVAWPASGAGNDSYLEFNIELDNNYGHILTDMSCWMFRAATGFEVEAVGRIRIKPDSSVAAETIVHPLVSYAGRSDGSNTAIGSMTPKEYNTQHPTDNGYEMVFTLANPKPTYVIYPYTNPGKGSSTVDVVFSDPELNNFSKTVYFVAKFLQYDISQGYHWAINSPISVR